MTTITKPTHNYQRKIARLIRKGKIRPVIGVHDLEVKHDDWCAALKGGTCNCNPDIYHNGERVG